MSRATLMPLAMLAAVLITARSANAHPVYIQRGVVTLDDDHAEVEFAISAHEAEHLGTTTPAIADELRRSLCILDEYGARLRLDNNQKTAAQHSDNLMLHLSYVLGADCRYLTLQQRLPSDSLAHHRQMQLAIVRRGTPDTDRRTIRLSNAGNAVTIQRQPSSTTLDLDDVDPYRDPLLLLSPMETGTRLELHVPAPLMETWLPIERARQDVITADDLEAMSPVIHGWFRDRFSFNDGADAATIRMICLLRPGDVTTDRLTDRTPRTSDVGFWCARIAIVADVRHTLDTPAELKCSVFNNAVLSLPVCMIDDQLSVQWQRTISTYSPTMRLDRRASE